MQKDYIHQNIYNLCADADKDLNFCFGIQLYRLYKANIKYYFEWHAAAIHNYPGFDLDGRESDIGIFYPKKNGEVGLTKRYIETASGIETFNKLILLEHYLKNRKAKGLKENEAQKWIDKINSSELYPIKAYYEKNHLNSKLLQAQLDKYLETFFI